MNRSPRMAPLGWIVLALLAVGTGCHKKQAAPQGRPPVVVQTGQTVRKDVPVTYKVFGQAVAFNDVNITPQVSGVLMDAPFTEGQAVKKGDLLFRIDPRPFQAALDKARASLAAAEANLAQARETLERNRPLIAKQLISQDAFDTYSNQYAAAVAQVALDRAAVEAATIDLDYCVIRSPIDGITGKRLVDPGNVVSAQQTALLNLRTPAPLYVDFSVPENLVGSVRKSAKAGLLRAAVNAKDTPEPVWDAQVSLIDNAVSDSTGTLALRALLPNEDLALWPGQFVDVVVCFETLTNVVVAPGPAVQIGKNGYYAFSLDEKGVAQLRPVRPGVVFENEVVIQQGLDAGETVVTLGLFGLYPGAQTMPAPPVQGGASGHGKAPPAGAHEAPASTNTHAEKAP